MIYWLVVGLIAGWLAGLVMKGGGYGIIVDILLGIVGGWLGGWLFGRLGIWPAGGHDWLDHRGLCRRRHPRRDHPDSEKSLTPRFQAIEVS